MDVIEAIRNRKSVKRLVAPGPTSDQVELLLELAATAPDHGGLQPWRHLVLAGAELAEFPLDAGDSPTVVVVGVEPTGDKIAADDQVAAAAASAQLLLLAAEGLGLGAMWRTGSAAKDPAVARAAGLSPAGHIVAFVHIGTPADPELRAERSASAVSPTASQPVAPFAAAGATSSPAPVSTATSGGDGDLGIGSLR